MLRQSFVPREINKVILEISIGPPFIPRKVVERHCINDTHVCVLHAQLAGQRTRFMLERN